MSDHKTPLAVRRSSRIKRKREYEQRDLPVRDSKRVKTPCIPFRWIPEEIFCHIMGFLHNVFDALILRRVCKKWHRFFEPIDKLDLDDARNWGCLTSSRICDHFFEYHLVRNHTSVLREYFGRTHIRPSVLHKIVDQTSPISTLSVATMQWLHCEQNMILTKGSLRRMIKDNAVHLLDWVCSKKEARIITTEPQDDTLICRESVLWSVTKHIIRAQSAPLWGWLRDCFYDLYENCVHHDMWGRSLPLSLGNDSRFFVIRMLDTALESDFGPAVADILVEVNSIVCTETQQEELAACMSAALIGNNVDHIDTVYELIHRFAFHHIEETFDVVKHWASITIKANACMSYIWLCRHFPQHLVEPTLKKVVDLITKYREKCLPLFETLLDCWPGLLTDRLERYDTHDPDDWSLTDLQHLVVREGLYEILYAANPRSRLIYTRGQLRTAVGVIKHHWGSFHTPHRQAKTLHYLAETVGLTQPNTWVVRQPFFTWQ